MLSVDLPVSLKVSLRLSPFRRLMPLKDESCAVVVICAMMLLYWLTRLERMVWLAGSATAAFTVKPVTAAPPEMSTASAAVGAVPVLVMTCAALSLVEVKVIVPAALNDAVRPMPPAVKAVFRASIELTLPAPATLLSVRLSVPVEVLRVSAWPCSELAPPRVRSTAVPGELSGAAPVGALVVTLAFDVYPVVVCRTWLAIDLAVSTSFCSEVMRVLAACSTCTPLPMPSSRLLMSLARLSRPEAGKELVGLSSAELTLLPVARRFCVVESKSAVACSERRFWRTDAERTMPDICETFLVYIRKFYSSGVSPRRFACFLPRNQRSSCSTLCCDCLASPSAETGIDCEAH